jgi:hypothetical protein
MVDANGRAVRRRYPDTYWELQRDLERLQEQQRAATKHIADLRKQAEQVKANAPTPPFAGKLSPVDQRGVPVMLPAGVEFNPASQPTTREARDVPALIAAPEPEPSRDLPSTAPSMPDTAAPATAPASSSRGLFE